MEKPLRGGTVVPDVTASGGKTTDMMREIMEMKMLETAALQSYSAPGVARKVPEVEWVRNTLDGSILKDHKGYPVSVNRILATKPLRAELSSRPGPGGKKLTYMSGEGVTRTLNEIFGFDGWNLEIVKTQREECVRDDKGRFHVAYTAQVRLTHKKSGTYKEDVGASDSIDRILGTAVAHALKGSITDALKRAARHFGEKLGNTLYQGDFSINKAPVTLREALDMYDKERATTKFGPATTTTGGKPTPESTSEAATATAKGNHGKVPLLNATPVAPLSSSSAPPEKTVVSAVASCHTRTQQRSSESSTHSSVTMAETPSASTGTRTVVSATPANKFRNQHEILEPLINPPKLQLPPSRQGVASNNTATVHPPPLPPLSAAQRLRNQSSMFGGGSFDEKENALSQSVPRQGNGMLVRPKTSNGRKSDPGPVDWSQQQQQQQLGGLKRQAGSAIVDSAVSNKRMNANPYSFKST